MSIKDNYETQTISDSFKEQNVKFVLSKKEDDLYHDEDNVIHPLIRIKLVSMPNKGEKWKIMQENKLIFTLDGHKLTKKERSFLHTINGINFLIAQFKTGAKSFNTLKIGLKKQIKMIAAVKNKKNKKT